jgi:hypothetical protein
MENYQETLKDIEVSLGIVPGVCRRMIRTHA